MGFEKLTKLPKNTLGNEIHGRVGINWVIDEFPTRGFQLPGLVYPFLPQKGLVTPERVAGDTQLEVSNKIILKILKLLWFNRNGKIKFRSKCILIFEKFVSYLFAS